MTLKQLETFYWICRLGGFSAAAGRLHTTQSAISVRIRDLEASLGVVLFDRNLRAAKLTAKGHELLTRLEPLIFQLTDLKHRVGDPKVFAGQVRLGVTEFVAVSWLPRLVRAIHGTYPEIVLELEVDLALNQERKLTDGILDVALIPGPTHEPGIAMASLGEVEFAWMASPQLGLPKGRIQPVDINGVSLLAPSRDSKLHTLLDAWLAESGVAGWRTDICNSIGTLADLTMAGLGISYLPKSFYAKAVAEGRLQVIDLRPSLPRLEYVVAYERRRSQPLVQAIVTLACRVSTFSRKRTRSPGASRPRHTSRDRKRA